MGWEEKDRGEREEKGVQRSKQYRTKSCGEIAPQSPVVVTVSLLGHLFHRLLSRLQFYSSTRTVGALLSAGGDERQRTKFDYPMVAAAAVGVIACPLHSAPRSHRLSPHLL